MGDENTFASRYEWERIMRRCRLSPMTKYVGMTLAQYANSDGTNAFPSVAKLARVTCLGERTVRKALTDLRALGLIKRVQKGGLRGTQGYSDMHCLAIPADLFDKIEVLTPTEDDPTPNRHHVPPGNGPNRHVVPPKRHESAPQPASDDTPTGTTCLLPITTYPPGDPTQDQRGPSVPDVTTGEDDGRLLYARLYAIDQLDAARKGRTA